MVAGGKAQPVTDTPVGGAGPDAAPYRGKSAQGPRHGLGLAGIGDGDLRWNREGEGLMEGVEPVDRQPVNVHGGFAGSRRGTAGGVAGRRMPAAGQHYAGQGSNRGQPAPWPP